MGKGMSRIAARELALRLLFEIDFTGADSREVLASRLTQEAFDALRGEDALYEALPEGETRAYIEALVLGVQAQKDSLDEFIKKYAIGWQFGRIARVTVSILRLCMYELLHMPDVPQASSIDEAVEFAKNYDGTEAGAFINGILGSFVRAECQA